jgi:hypothetical protein
MADNGLQKPQLYIKDIKSAYISKMSADAAYNGILTKNPIHNSWACIAYEGSLAKAYTLGELARGIDLAGHRKTKARLREVIEGRNCSLFESLRPWAYQNVSGYLRVGRYDDYGKGWEAAVVAEAKVLAAGYLFGDRRFWGDVRSVARSIARFTWEKSQPDERAKYIAETHDSRSQKKRISKRWATESKKAAGLELLDEGKTVSEVTRQLLVGERTVKRWIAQAREAAREGNRL